MKQVFFCLIIILAFLLRIFLLGENPPSLYWDEASLGYNAYTIATSLRDEHGEFLPLNRFIAFGDYKPPGYIYAIVPFIPIFGLSEFSVRLPSMLAGFSMVILTYFLVKEITKKKLLANLSCFFLAVSPWSVHFSRAAFEANLAAFFNLLGIYFFILTKRKKWAIIFSMIFFFFSFYTFNANRIIAPLLFLALVLIYWKNIFDNLKWFSFSVLILVVLITPSLSYLRDRESRLRFQEVSIFNNLETVVLSNQRIKVDNESLLAKIIHNRRWLYFKDFLKHYFDNFSGRFLFTQGDNNPRLALQSMGQLYLWSLPFLLLGIYVMLKNFRRYLILFFWMLIVPIPAGTARETPHALRIISILPTYQIIISLGLAWSIICLKKRLAIIKFCLFVCFISFALMGNIFYYLHDYYIHYPYDWSGEWQYGYKEMVSYIKDIGDSYDQIYVTNSKGRPYIFFAFYQRYPLPNFLKEKKASRDWFGFWEVSKLGKITFNLNDVSLTNGKILVVTSEENLPNDFKLLKVIKNLKGEDVFLIGEKL